MPSKKIVSKVRLLVPVDLQKVPEHMANNWVNVQVVKLDSTEMKRSKAIPDEMRYIAKMAGPSSAAYAEFISPTFVSRRGKNRDAIVTAQSANMGVGYQKYKKSLELLNQDEGKRYKERIAIKKEAYSRGMGRKGLPFTGETTTGKGICSIVPAWLVGEKKIVGYLAGAGDLSGGPVNVARMDDEVDLRTALKAAISGQLSKTGVIIINGDFQPNVIKRQNDVLNAIIRGMQDTVKFTPFETEGESHCDYVMDGPTMHLEIQVTRITP